MISRPYRLPDGSIEQRRVYVCHCGERRGSPGGSCAVCQDAIPSDAERLEIERGLDLDD